MLSCLTLCNPRDYSPPGSFVHGALQARILERVAMPSTRGSSEPRSPSLQADSILSEPPGKPNTSGVGSLSLLQGIFPIQELNWGFLHCRQILYQLSQKASPRILEWVAYPSPADLPDPGIEPGSPALQADSLSTELSGKPKGLTKYQIEGMTGSVLC